MGRFEVNAKRSLGAGVYFAYTGGLILVVATLTIIERLQLGAYGWMQTRQLLAIGIATGICILACVIDQLKTASLVDRFLSLRVANASVARIIFVAGAATCAIATLGLVVADHRWFVLVIAICQVAFIHALKPDLSSRDLIIAAAVSLFSWTLASGMTYTHLYDWLLNLGTTGAFAIVAFVFSFGVVTTELVAPNAAPSNPRVRWAVTAIAVIIFAANALRTDHFMDNWVPIHREYFADTAQFVKDGHWLLWDVPSLYGFLSILTIAAIPAKTAFQSLYELTAIFLFFEAFAIFTILRTGRAGWTNALFAIAFPVATIFGENLSRYAWGPRLYPQGGLRFEWIVALIFIAFLRYRWRHSTARRRALTIAGTTIWTIGLFWAIENAIWVTAVWPTYLVFDFALNGPAREPLLQKIVRGLATFAPFALLPIACVLMIDQFYLHALGHSPDWRGFAEFTGLFTGGAIRAIFNVQYLGNSWIFFLVLGAIGVQGFDAIRRGNRTLFTLLLATWLAVWITISYFAVEPLDMYVTLLLEVLAPAIAVAIFASRELPSEGSELARLSLAPIAVIAVAFSFGEPGRAMDIRVPVRDGFNALQSMTPLHGELATLMQRAGITASDAVLLPNGPLWTEPTQGIVLPFGRDASGKVFEYRSWLPTSPVGSGDLFLGLSPERRSVYIDRFLNVGNSAGWYITYRVPADCSQLSPRLATGPRFSSANFSAARCRVKGKVSS